jgi:hypothetical protein
MIISGSKSVKMGQKILKKATTWTYTWFFQKNLAFMSLYSFRTYFFTLVEVQASFLNLLTTANNYRIILGEFF